MTNKTIYENLKRLLIFLDVYKEEKISKFNNDNTIKPIDLVHEYSRHLDIYGCHKSGLSYFILNDSDFNEVKNMIIVNFPDDYNKKSKLFPPNRLFGLFIDGYEFIIENKDVKAFLSICMRITEAQQENGKTILYLSTEDHWDEGKLSPANTMKKIKIASTSDEAYVVESNSNTPYKHFIVVDKLIDIKAGETIINLN